MCVLMVSRVVLLCLLACLLEEHEPAPAHNVTCLPVVIINSSRELEQLPTTIKQTKATYRSISSRLSGSMLQIFRSAWHYFGRSAVVEEEAKPTLYGLCAE